MFHVLTTVTLLLSHPVYQYQFARQIIKDSRNCSYWFKCIIKKPLDNK